MAPLQDDNIVGDPIVSWIESKSNLSQDKKARG